MLKTIKKGDNIGIAVQVQGQIVDTTQDEYGTWHYEFKDEKWIASDYAFED